MDKFWIIILILFPKIINPVNTLTYKWFHREDYGMVKYSVRHFADFYRGIRRLAKQFDDLADLPLSFKIYIERIFQLLKETPLQRLSETKNEPFTLSQNLYFAFHLRGHYKTDTLELIEIFIGLMPGIPWPWLSKHFNLGFPGICRNGATAYLCKRSVSPVVTAARCV